MLVDLGLNKFRCDDCGKEVIVKTFPEGWVWLKATMRRPVIEHRCEQCKPKVPPNEIGDPGRRG